MCHLLPHGPSSLSHWVFPAAWLSRRHRAVQRAGAGLRPLAEGFCLLYFTKLELGLQSRSPHTQNGALCNLFLSRKQDELHDPLLSFFPPLSTFPHKTVLSLSFSFLLSMAVTTCRPWQHTTQPSPHLVLSGCLIFPQFLGDDTLALCINRQLPPFLASSGPWNPLFTWYVLALNQISSLLLLGNSLIFQWT